jgi:hypothetical protein
VRYIFEQNGYVFRDKIRGFNQWALLIITFDWLRSYCWRTHYIRFTLARVYARTHLPQDVRYKFFLFFWSNGQWFLETTSLRYFVQVSSNKTTRKCFKLNSWSPMLSQLWWWLLGLLNLFYSFWVFLPEEQALTAR